MIDSNYVHIVEFYIKYVFYYVEYPKGVDEGFWKDKNGEYQFIPEMRLRHLHASIQRVKKDMHWYETQTLKDSNYQKVKNAILPLTEKKLEELTQELKRRMDKK